MEKIKEEASQHHNNVNSKLKFQTLATPCCAGRQLRRSLCSFFFGSAFWTPFLASANYAWDCFLAKDVKRQFFSFDLTAPFE